MWIVLQWLDYAGEGKELWDLFGPFDALEGASEWLATNRTEIEDRELHGNNYSYEIVEPSSPNIWRVSDGTRA